MRQYWPSLLLLVLLAHLALGHVRYDGYQVVKVSPRTEQEAQWVAREVAAMTGTEMWRWGRAGGEVLMPGKAVDSFLSALSSRDVPGAITIHDVQQLIESQEAAGPQPPAIAAFDHTDYHDLQYINSLLDQLEAEKDIVSTYVIGTSLEGRQYRVVEISSGGEDTRPVVWLDCGIHAREWIAPATCQWILDKLTTGYGVDIDMTTLLDTYDFHILPVVNVDGYAFTWTEDRLWRKNRHPYNESDECVGVDPNRNFDYHFGGLGSSDLHCLPIYRGEFAFSEYESQALRDALSALSGRLKAYFALHSYAQMWMTPWGYTFEKPPEYEEQLRVAEVGAAALAAVHGTTYSVGNLASTIYPSAGMTGDWVYGVLGVTYNYVLELRDLGTYGFLLPPEYIQPVGEETWAGLQAAINAIPLS